LQIYTSYVILSFLFEICFRQYPDDPECYPYIGFVALSFSLDL